MRPGTLILLLLVGLAAASGPAAAQDPPSPTALVTQGRRLANEGKQDEAIALYEKALALEPTLFDAHLAMGIALDLKGQHGEARRHFATAIEQAPDEVKNRALGAMAVSYAFESRAGESAKYYEQAYERDLAAGNFGGAAGWANALGRAYLESGDTAGAYRWYQTGYETARRQPEGEGAQLPLWQLRWLHAQARISARAGRAEEARRSVAEARVLVESSSSLAGERQTFQYLVGYVALYLKDYDTAISALLQADQEDVFIQGLLAQAYEQRGDRLKARQYWTQSLESTAHSLQNAFTRPKALKALGR